MATFAEGLAARKAQAQPGQLSYDIEQPSGVQPPQGQFGARLAQRKAETEQRAAGREQTIQQTPSLAGRISEAFTGAQRQTPETQELPEFRQTKEVQGFAPRGLGTQLKLTAGLLSSFSPEAQMDIIKNSIPEAQFRQDAKGNVIVDIEGQQSILNKPGFSGQDAVQALTQTLAAFGPARLSSLAKSTFARVVGVGAGEAAVEQGRQEVSRFAGSEQPREPGMTALAGAIGGAAELVGPVREALRNRSAARRLGAEAAELVPASENIAVAKAAEEATGIPLFQAQKSAIPSQLEKQSFIAQLPAGTQKSVTALRAQNEAASEAVESFMQQIAPPEAVTTGAERFRNASQKAVDAQKAIRKERTSPLFKDAFKNTEPVDVTSVRGLLENKILDSPPGSDLEKVMKRISGFIEGAPNLAKLQKTKLQIDDMISKFGEGSLGNSTKREVLEVKSTLLNSMDSVSPEFKAAREAFTAESPAVTALEESIIGKVAAFDDTSLKRISRTIFDPAETNPQVVASAKKIINETDPEAWNQLLRVELERRLGSISTDVADGGIGAIENVPRLLERSLFGNTKQQAILFNAVDTETAKNLKFLQTALKRAKLGRPGGSQTAIREEIKRELRGGVTQRIRNFFRAPLNTLVETGEDVAFNRRVRAMAEVMFDPKHKKQMAKIRKLNPNTAAAGKAMAQLLKNIDINTEREQQ